VSRGSGLRRPERTVRRWVGGAGTPAGL